MILCGADGREAAADRGNPVDNETQAAYILSYSPLDNVRPQAYPHMLASGGAGSLHPMDLVMFNLGVLVISSS